MQRPWGDEHSPWVHHQGLPRVDTAQLEGPAEDREVLRKKGRGGAPLEIRAAGNL